jgi:hypothetical protein
MEHDPNSPKHLIQIKYDKTSTVHMGTLDKWRDYIDVSHLNDEARVKQVQNFQACARPGVEYRLVVWTLEVIPHKP